MVKKYIKRLIFIIFIFSIVYITQVFAVNNYTCDVLITEDKTELKPGESVVYEIKATNINANTGIIMFEALIDYNKNIFDCSIESDDSKVWNNTSFIENNIIMTRSDLMPSTEDQVIAKVILTVKEQATIGKQAINITKMRFTMDNNEYFEVEDISKSVEIISNQIENQEDINNEDNGYQQSQEVNVEDKQQNQQIVQANLVNNVTSPKTLPFAGTANFIKVIIVALLVTLAVAFYNKYRKIKDI